MPNALQAGISSHPRSRCDSFAALLSSTEPIRAELKSALPERPFSIHFWDGTEVPSTNGGGPRFTVRSPAAFAHALRAPGQLGLGRAYVSGEIEVDDVDEVLDLLDSWQPPPLDRATRGRLALAAAPAAVGAASTGKAPQPRARRARGAASLRPAAGVLRALPRPVDDLQLRGLLARGDHARGGSGDKARDGLHQARPQAGRA